jgi:hypothetical protein
MMNAIALRMGRGRREGEMVKKKGNPWVTSNGFFLEAMGDL